MPARIRLATCVGVRRRDWRTVGLRRRVDEDAAHVYSSSHMLIPCNQPALFDRGGRGGDAARSVDANRVERSVDARLGETRPFGLPTCSECWVIQGAYRCYAHCGSRVSCASATSPRRRDVGIPLAASCIVHRASRDTDVRDGRSFTASTTPMSAFCATKPSTTNTPPGPTDNNKPLDTNHPWDVLAGCVPPSSNHFGVQVAGRTSVEGTVVHVVFPVPDLVLRADCAGGISPPTFRHMPWSGHM